MASKVACLSHIADFKIVFCSAAHTITIISINVKATAASSEHVAHLSLRFQLELALVKTSIEWIFWSFFKTFLFTWLKLLVYRNSALDSFEVAICIIYLVLIHNSE